MAVCSEEGTILTSDAAGVGRKYHQPGSAADVAAFLQRSRGVARKEQIAAYIDAQLAPQRERAAREHANVELWQRAYRLEKESAQESASAYRESIQAWKATLRARQTSRWDYLEDSYNRLTLMLEKMKRFSEALHEIEDYNVFCTEMGREPQVDTIAKREARIKKRVPQPR
jgi:hypothetical protein